MAKKTWIVTISIALVLSIGIFYLLKTGKKTGEDAGIASMLLPPDNLPMVSTIATPVGAKFTDTAVEVSAEDRKKFGILMEILLSRSDNDPRLDRELKELPAGSKELFFNHYRFLARERLNERGTVVFLIGRNLTRQKDFDFLCSVLDEPPCLSLSDCQKAETSKQDYERDSGEEVTLAYPQLVALNAATAYLERIRLSHNRREMEFFDSVLQVIKCGMRSKVATISQKAELVSRGVTR
ncbi:MAG: hypothetical protein AABZ06_10550 [Bdellovibrionota bacterium]